MIRRHPAEGPGYAWSPPPVYRVTFASLEDFSETYRSQIRHHRLALEAHAVVGLGGAARVELCIPTNLGVSKVNMLAWLVSYRPAMDTLREEVAFELLIDHATHATFRNLIKEVKLQERRAMERCSYTEPVRVIARDCCCMVRGIDLSEGGLAVTGLSQPIEIHSRVDVIAPLSNGPAFKAQGRVAWTRANPFGDTRVVGIAFEPLAKRTRRRIQSWMELTRALNAPHESVA